MAITLEDLAEQRESEIREAIDASNRAASSAEALAILLQAIENLRNAVSDSVMESITVDNFDEVQAALRNELSKMSKPLIKAIKKLSLSENRMVKVLTDINKKNMLVLDKDDDIQIIRKPKKGVRVENISDIFIPDEVNVKNLQDLQEYFDNLTKVIRETFNVDIPTPKVNVEAPVVNVPETLVNVAPPDLKPLLNALDPLKFLSDRAKKPLAVRISDGQKFIKFIQQVVKNQERQVQAFSQGLTESAARKAFKQATVGVLAGVGSKELTNAGTAVQITTSSTPCKYVDISTTKGLAAIGTSGAVQTADGEVGVQIYPGNLPYRVWVDNLNKVYAAGATNTRLAWAYYT